MLTTVIYAFLFAATAIIYSEVLLAPGMILERLGRILEQLPEWLAKPLGDCVYCFGGQLALWGYVILAVQGKIVYSWLDHVLEVGLTIFIIHIYKIMEERWN